jgi:hypothetical protein
MYAPTKESVTTFLKDEILKTVSITLTTDSPEIAKLIAEKLNQKHASIMLSPDKTEINNTLSQLSIKQMDHGLLPHDGEPTLYMTDNATSQDRLVVKMDIINHEDELEVQTNSYTKVRCAVSISQELIIYRYNKTDDDIRTITQNLVHQFDLKKIEASKDK